MNLDVPALETACYELVRTMRWKGGVAEEVMARALVPAYVETAQSQVEYLAQQGIDPNFVVRAVRYLAASHAIPPLEGNIDWFRTSMDILVELACPSSAREAEHEQFFQEITRGIAVARNV